MASVYQTRQNTKYKYLITNNLAPNTITNHSPINTNTYTYFSTVQLEKPILALPNLFTTTTYTSTKYQKLNKKKPKSLKYFGYLFINTLALLKCGDIELNPGPMPNILHTQLAIYKKRAKTYFIPNTIKFQPEY